MDTTYWNDYYLKNDPTSIPWNKTGKLLFDDFSDKLILADPILDIGCGAGYKIKYLQSLGKDIYGFDFSEEAIKQANNERAILGDLNNLSAIFPDITFNTALDLFSSQFERERRNYIKQLNERLNEGGMILLAQFTPEHPYGKTDKDVIAEWLDFELLELKRYSGGGGKPFNAYLFQK